MKNRDWFEACVRELFDRCVEAHDHANGSDLQRAIGEWLKEDYQPVKDRKDSHLGVFVGDDCPDFVFGALVGPFAGEDLQTIRGARQVGKASEFAHEVMKLLNR